MHEPKYIKTTMRLGANLISKKPLLVGIIAIEKVVHLELVNDTDVDIHYSVDGENITMLQPGYRSMYAMDTAYELRKSPISYGAKLYVSVYDKVPTMGSVIVRFIGL